MTPYRHSAFDPRRTDVEVLLIPARPLTPAHWMWHWAQRNRHCRIVELGMWDEPHRNTWVNKLNLAIGRSERPVVLVTEDVAALALAWWVEYERVGSQNPVVGAFVVNPPDVDRPGLDPRVARFGAIPRQEMPFRTFVVAHALGDNYYQRAIMRLTRDWGACPVCDFAQGPWPRGWAMLQSVLGLSLDEPENAIVRPRPVREAPLRPVHARTRGRAGLPNPLAHVVWC